MIIKKRYDQIFSINIFNFLLKDFTSLNDKLTEHIYNERDKEVRNSYYSSNAPRIRSNRGGWHSHYMLQNNSNFDIFTEKLISIINTEIVPTFFNNKLQLDKNDVNGLWAIINKKGNYNALHNHPNAWLSGVYYVKSEGANSGKICFKDPISARTSISYAFDEVRGIGNTGSDYDCLQPDPGLLVLFPSYLEHMVEENESNSDRISLSFNIYPKIEERNL